MMLGASVLAMTFPQDSSPKKPTVPGHQRTQSIGLDPGLANSVTRTTISLEYASLRHKVHCPLGMYIIPSTDNILVWDGVLFVHKGYYADSILKFHLMFPQNYPERPPTVQFSSAVFHPLINPQTGVMNLQGRFRPWRPKEHHSFEVLHFIKASFKKQALDRIKEHDCLNKEAFRYHDPSTQFANLATQTSQLSQSSTELFPGKPSSTNGKSRLAFQELKPELTAEIRHKLGLKDWDSTMEVDTTEISDSKPKHCQTSSITQAYNGL